MQLLLWNVLDLMSLFHIVYHIWWFVVTVLILLCFVLFVYFLLDFLVMLQLIFLLLHWKIRIHFWKIKKWDTWSTFLIWRLSFKSLDCFLSWFILWQTSLNFVLINWLVVILFNISWISTVISVEFVCHTNIALSFHINFWHRSILLLSHQCFYLLFQCLNFFILII